jgi:hypothetical protein
MWDAKFPIIKQHDIHMKFQNAYQVGQNLLERGEQHEYHIAISLPFLIKYGKCSKNN